MSRDFPELDQLRIEVEGPVRARHLSAIGVALRSARSPRTRRFRLLAVAMALVLALPAIAFASEDAVPGDALYPVKRILEPLVALFDEDVAVDHRVDEVEALHERGARVDLIRERVDRAWEVVSKDHPNHARRLEAVVDDLDDDRVDTRVDPAESSHSDETDESSSPSPSSSVDGDERSHSTDETHATTTTITDRTTSSTRAGRDG